jgi:tartrate-resistant acid phosphatase type 5
MPGETHREPFIHLAEVAHDRALVGWGAFWFQRRDSHQRWEIVDDEGLRKLVGRHTSIGSSAEPFGDATVRVYRADGAVVAEESTSERTWVWVVGLQPDTDYRYEVIVDGVPWAADEHRDWLPAARGGYDLEPSGRRYDLRFHTFPSPGDATPRTSFVALGDYGVGTRSDAESSRRQRRVADVLDRLVERHEVRFVVSLGDNVYQGEHGQVDDESGGEDDDWYSSFYQPYRYVISRVPFYPTVGNHDDAESEGGDDRAQMDDNFHLANRFGTPLGGDSSDEALFYRVRVGRDLELVCVDTSVATTGRRRRLFNFAAHRRWLEETFSGADVRWRIPFSHHPAYTAGPDHGNDDGLIKRVLPMFRRGGVRLALAGHEHNFQVSEADGMMFVVSGAGGKVDEALPDRFREAHTTAWAAQAHLTLVEVDGGRLMLTPISGLRPDGELHRMSALTPNNEVVYPPIELRSEATPER